MSEEKPRRRLATFNQALRYIGCGRTRAYQLIAEGRIIALKDGARTKIDLDSVDQYHANLPQLTTVAS